MSLSDILKPLARVIKDAATEDQKLESAANKAATATEKHGKAHKGAAEATSSHAKAAKEIIDPLTHQKAVYQNADQAVASWINTLRNAKTDAQAEQIAIAGFGDKIGKNFAEAARHMSQAEFSKLMQDATE